MDSRALLLAAIASVAASGCWLREPFQRLDYRVVDAEYSQSLKRVVMVSAAPPTLHLYDASFRREEAVPLPADPTCIGLSPDGRFAAVGHDHLVSYVDLDATAVVASYPVSGNVSGVVLADNGRIYALLGAGAPYLGISVVDLTSGVEQKLTSGGTQARQQPNKELLYVLNNALIPESLSSYDIRGGAAAPLHLSPYRGDRPYCGKLWFSEQGERIFTACGDTLRTSSSRDEDMRYVGSLANLTGVQSLSHSSASHHLIAIPKLDAFSSDPPADTRLQLYNDAYLEYRGSRQLPCFFVDDQTVAAAHGRYVFFDDSGLFYIVIQQADPSAGLEHDFAIFEAPFVPSSFTGASGPTPPPAPTQAFATFDRPLEDAEYDAELDRIVYVSSDPDTLHVLDPETGADDVVPLPYPPNSVSIGPAGDRAAVGHDGGRVSLVDLSSATLLETYPTSGDVLDVVLTSNWVYAFPRGTGSGFLRGIELATGSQETAIWPVSGDSRAKPDSTGNKLYVADNWGSPSTLTLFDSSQHPAKYVRTIFPYPPKPQICGDVWSSQDGLRIFTRCGGVYHSSTDAAVDMTVEGQLQGLGLVRHLSDSIPARTIAAIPGVPDYDGYGFAVIPGGGWDGDRSDDTRVELFDASDLSLERKLALPAFSLGSTSAPARGRFVFFNDLGTRLYVIVEADPAAGLANGFGLVSFDVQP